MTTQTTSDDIRKMAHEVFQMILDRIQFYERTDNKTSLQCDLEGCIDTIESVYEKGWNDAKGI